MFSSPRSRSKWIHPTCTLVATVLMGLHALADDPPKNAEDLQREKAIAEFTAKMKAANYPSLFDKAAAEFGVPSDILKGVAFAETRWEHLTWPPGETASPETGMPRPYGIMSLWDNEYFGHSLTEAAQLIGEDPQKLKDDPLTNIRGGAALLKKIYGENPKPEGTTEADIESWRYAIVKYCGIPEPDLSHRHGLNVYEFMNEGYHQYGIEWNARTVNLAPMRAEVKKIVAEEDKKREARMRAEGLLDEVPTNATATASTPPKPTTPAPTPTSNTSSTQEITLAKTEQFGIQPSILGKTVAWIGGPLLLFIGLGVWLKRKKASAPKK